MAAKTNTMYIENSDREEKDVMEMSAIEMLVISLALMFALAIVSTLPWK